MRKARKCDSVLLTLKQPVVENAQTEHECDSVYIISHPRLYNSGEKAYNEYKESEQGKGHTMRNEIDTEPDLEVKSNNVITRVWDLGDRIKLPVQFASPELCLSLIHI